MDFKNLCEKKISKKRMTLRGTLEEPCPVGKGNNKSTYKVKFTHKTKLRFTLKPFSFADKNQNVFSFTIN